MDVCSCGKLLSRFLFFLGRRARLAVLDEQLQADEAHWKWAEKLDAIRVKTFALALGKYDKSITTKQYPPVFKQMKLDVEKGDAAQVAAQIHQSSIRFALVAALDHWAEMLSEKDLLVPRLLEIARRADPDPWRNHAMFRRGPICSSCTS
jgi:hypothetical protein